MTFFVHKWERFIWVIETSWDAFFYVLDALVHKWFAVIVDPSALVGLFISLLIDNFTRVKHTLGLVVEKIIRYFWEDVLEWPLK